MLYIKANPKAGVAIPSNSFAENLGINPILPQRPQFLRNSIRCRIEAISEPLRRSMAISLSLVALLFRCVLKYLIWIAKHHPRPHGFHQTSKFLFCKSFVKLQELLSKVVFE